MDKLLLAAFISSLAGFITAVLSVVKLVNEKENKTSEFRQSWTNSARSCIADLAAKLGAITSASEYFHRLSDVENKLTSLIKKDANAHIQNQKRLELIRNAYEKTNDELSKLIHDQYQCYALCKLHFKPNDADFKPIEEKFEIIASENKKMRQIKDGDIRKEIKESNLAHMNEIVEQGRQILKGEWERVKLGEKAYQNTKKYSFYGGLATLGILIVTGGLSYLAVADTYKNHLNNSTSNSDYAKRNVTAPCWLFQSLKGQIYKLNSCTGELVEIKNDVIHKSK